MALFAGNGALAVILECDFKQHHSYWGEKYACVAKNLKSTLSDRKVVEVRGTHATGMTNADVKKVLIVGQYCPYLPINLGSHFKNLEVLYVMKSNLSHLTDDDLTGLKLKIFDVSYNPIKRLHKDYFKGQDSIEIISFYDCELNYVERGVLDPLKSLKEGHFQFNECVDYRGDDEGLLSDLRQELAFCDPKYKLTHRDMYHDYDEFDYTTVNVRNKFDDHRIAEVVLPKLSFLQRHAVVITSLLFIAVLALLGLLYKLNAFNRQSWR